jgi:hypothetical protein
MFNKVKIPFIKAVSITTFSFLVLSYQNCAKPLDDIGLNNSNSLAGICDFTLSGTSIVKGLPFSATYTYAPSTEKFHIIVMDPAGATVAENTFTQNGTLSLPTATLGNYIVSGSVLDNAGATLGTCQKSYLVKTVVAVPEPPAPPMPTITLSGSSTTCVGSCTVNLTHNATDLTSSGSVFRIVRVNGATTADVVCKTTSGSAVTAVSLSNANNPGLNSFMAYLVSTCTSPVSGTPSATFNVSVSAAASGYTYSWVANAWGMCDAACDDVGTQSRSVYCKRNDGVTVADVNCTGAKPATTQTCYGRVCRDPSCAPGTVCP